RKRADPQTAQTPPSRDRSIDVPLIGRIADIEFPEGPVARPDLPVAVVLDEFSRVSFQYEFAVTDVPARGWRPVLEAKPPRLLLVESAYRGHDGSWAGRVARFGRPSQELTDVVSWCRDRGIPTVFWVKEDPINHDWFSASAGLFDWVLTVDSNMVGHYRRRLGHERVDVMQFAAQPVVHHPGPEDRVERVAFAGSYFAAKHEARREQMDVLLTAALPYGLDIFDRMDRPDDPRFGWPESLREHIRGTLTYAQTVEAYRRYAAFINVNTVTNSPTMCARRIYELLACGSQVVSGPSDALEGVPVLVASDRDTAGMQIEKALSMGLNTTGQAWVESGHTMSHRVDRMLELIL
ncbi:MAG: family 2 glycosyl transferase, partial [Acidimicrobiia bacterium]